MALGHRRRRDEGDPHLKKQLLIRGGLLVDPSCGLDGPRDLLLDGGRVAAVGRPGALKPAGAETLDARGCWVVPGLIDMHVHLREPGREEDETIATGTAAAAAGGVTTLLTMPNTRPATDTPERVRAVRAAAAASARVNVLVAGAVTLGQEGRALADLPGMAEAGACAFSDDGMPVMDASLMRGALEASKALGLPVLDHAEDLSLTGAGVLHEGSCCRRLGVPGIPSASEAAMAARDAALAACVGGRLHLCHVSAKETVAIVRAAKRAGVPVTAEAAPHHFALCDSDIPGPDPDWKMKPPIRSAADRRAVIAGLADGTIDAIATDHAPHSPDKKARGLAEAPFGIIGLETLLPLSLALVRARALSRSELIDRLSTGPARILGLKKKGTLRRGADADVTVIDPSARRAAGPPFQSKSRNSPFSGRKLQGFTRATVVSGEVVFRA